MKPALTAEEWNHSPHRQKVSAIRHLLDTVEEDRIHAVAALALYGQPFGFTRRDADAVRIASISAETPAHYEELHSLADRIEALLPPEG